MFPLLLPLRVLPAHFPGQGLASGDSLTLNIGSEGFRCPEHISAPLGQGSKRISAFCWVFYLFPGIRQGQQLRGTLDMVVYAEKHTIRGMQLEGVPLRSRHPVTEVLGTVRRCYIGSPSC